MTQENKSNKRLIYVMAALFAIVLVGLNVVITAYYFETKNKDAQIKQLNDEIDSIQAQITNLTMPAAAPKLITVGLQFYDNRTNPATPFLQVTGYVVNVGTAQANNCSIHVFAIQNENSTAIDTWLAINSVDSEATQAINLQFAYVGQPLVAYSGNLDWKN